ncbi:MAG TPA: endonuclease/exonuclease/phosphatase family protein [Polyangiaceae bacterium]|nr:endonuclease/exonuclease/phosphatase family protein [Polyangiaceae bacterium]
MMRALLRTLGFGMLACAPSLDADFGTSDSGRNGCGPSLAPHDVQSTAATSPLAGQVLEVGGVVTLAATSSPERAGFFLQSLAADADPRSSEALFVVWPGAPPPTGTRVRARGTVRETAGMTELDAIERLDECGTAGISPEPLDVRELEQPEAWEGMWVRAEGDWTLLDAPHDGGDGPVTASPRGRWYASGHVLGSADAPELWTVRAPPAKDRGPDAASPVLRLGAQLDHLSGVLRVEGEARELLSAQAPPWPVVIPAPPPRPAGSRLRLVALNLHNYFVDRGGRGAQSEAELERQRDKLVAALSALDADVLALTELENRGTESLAHLLDGLDRALPGSARYAFEEGPSPIAGVLRAGIAFRPARVRSRGAAWFSDTPGFRRPPLFQSFEAEGVAFTLGVVHLASKLCDDEPEVVSPEGCGDDTRRREAALLLDAARRLGAAAPLEPVLLMGDFNADTRESPLELLSQGGFDDLLSKLPAPDRYSYVFDARASLLDHALAPRQWAASVRGAAIWHINADEPRQSSDADGSSSADPRRSSDHDPIVIDW